MFLKNEIPADCKIDLGLHIYIQVNSEYIESSLLTLQKNFSVTHICWSQMPMHKEDLTHKDTSFRDFYKQKWESRPKTKIFSLLSLSFDLSNLSYLSLM